MIQIEKRQVRLESGRWQNQRTLLGYLAFFSSGHFIPPAPNPNVIAFPLPPLEELELLRQWAYELPFSFTAAEALLFPSAVTVPEVEGIDIGVALGLLQNATLLGVPVNVAADISIHYNIVVTQSIAAGTHVGQGTVINLTVQNQTVVPNLIGLSKEAATTALGTAVLGADPEPLISGLLPGTVISQANPPGTLLIANTVVTFQYAINGDGFRVQAVTAGWYGGAFYNSGDVFDILKASDFSDYTLNYEIAGAEYTAGWMKQVSQSTPLTQDDGSGFLVTLDPNRRFVE